MLASKLVISYSITGSVNLILYKFILYNDCNRWNRNRLFVLQNE